MSTLRDHGLEVIRKSGEEVTPGDKSDYFIKVGYNASSVNHSNPFPVTTSYEKILEAINQSKWMDLAVFNRIETTFSADYLSGNIKFYEYDAFLGEADIVFTSDISWSFDLHRYINDDDGTKLLDDDSTALNLD